jgi:hypothetical protein
LGKGNIRESSWLGRGKFSKTLEEFRAGEGEYPKKTPACEQEHKPIQMDPVRIPGWEKGISWKTSGFVRKSFVNDIPAGSRGILL